MPDKMLKSDPRCVLDENKRLKIIAMLSNGSSWRIAARFVGCAISTIGRTARRDPEFAAQLDEAEHKTEIAALRALHRAFQNPCYWRAAAWTLERRNREDFAKRDPDVITNEQIRQFMACFCEIMSEDISDEQYHKTQAKLDAMLEDFENQLDFLNPRKSLASDRKPRIMHPIKKDVQRPPCNLCEVTATDIDATPCDESTSDEQQ